MACPAIQTGIDFLGTTLAHIDCQAQSLGAFGYQALGASGSSAGAMLSGLLTLLVALFGYRLILGHQTTARDIISGVLLIGIALTLATSWIAFRTVVYDTVLYGPAEVAGEITGRSGLSSPGELVGRLQAVDNAIVAVTALGTGRPPKPSNAAQPSAPLDPAFNAIALEDEFGMGFVRIGYLAGTVAPLAFLRLAAGVLLALAPMFAGLLFFESTRAIFFGWLRALLATALGSLAMIVSLNVELALLEPLLTDILTLRGSRYITPSAPTELVVITTSFAVVTIGLIALSSRLAFNPHMTASSVNRPDVSQAKGGPGHLPAYGERLTPPQLPRAAQVGERLTALYRGERRPAAADGSAAPSPAVPSAVGSADIGLSEVGRTPSRDQREPLGGSSRRTSRRTSVLGTRRDGRA